MTKITLNKATCHLLEEGVILVTYKNNVEIDINEVIEIRNTTHQLANGKAFVAIYDAGEDTLITS
ncbi:MAG TPA: hypothetical protein PK649_04840 [Vicingus sp.]|nr:hypothetical protein [Vicingus sp.]